jgi:hypothetical protein
MATPKNKNAQTYILVEPDGTAHKVETKTYINLSQSQGLVNGPIHMIKLGRYDAYINDVGKLQHLPANSIFPKLVGNVVIGVNNPQTGSFRGLTEEEYAAAVSGLKVRVADTTKKLSGEVPTIIKHDVTLTMPDDVQDKLYQFFHDMTPDRDTDPDRSYRDKDNLHVEVYTCDDKSTAEAFLQMIHKYLEADIKRVKWAITPVGTKKKHAVGEHTRKLTRVSEVGKKVTKTVVVAAHKRGK